MKKKFIILTTVLITVAAILNSCGLFSSKGPGREYLDYLKSEEYKQDLDNLVYAATLKKCVKYATVKAFSNNYTLKKGQKLDFKRKRVEYWGELLVFMDALAEHQEEFEASIKRLEEHKVFSTASPVRNKKGKLTAQLPDLHLNGWSNPASFNIIATPAHAAQVEPGLIFQPLLVQEMAEFFGLSTELSKESRRMTIACAANLSNDDLKSIYNRLPSDIRGGTTDYKTWWNNLQNGKYDVKGHKIYHTIIDDQTHPSNLHFMEQADNFGLLDPQEFVKKAKRVVNAAAKLEIDLTNKVLGSVMPGVNGMPGYSDVYDKVEITVSTVNLGGKIATGEVTMEDAMDYVSLTEKTWLGEKIKGVNMNIPGVGSVELGSNPFVDAGEIQGTVNLTINKAEKAIDKLLGKDDDPKLDWEDEPEPATITVSDNDKDTPADKIIVEDTKTGEIYIGVGADKDGNTTVVVPGDGDYNITTVDQNGDKWTTTDKHVDNGETVELEGDTEEEEMWEEFFDEDFGDDDEDEEDIDEEEGGGFFDTLLDILNGKKDIFGNDIDNDDDDDEEFDTDDIDGIEDMSDEEVAAYKEQMGIEDDGKTEEGGKGFWGYLQGLLTGENDIFGNPIEKDPNAGVIPPGDEEDGNYNTDKDDVGEHYVPDPYKDDDEEDVPFIVGKWSTVRVEQLIDADEDDIIALDDEDWATARSIKFTARENGTCTLTSSQESVSGSYTFDGMTLAISAGGERIICPINKLGDNRMRLTYSDEDIIVILIMQKK